MTFISITRLRVRSWRFVPGFIYDAVRSARQAKTAEGILAVRLLRDTHNTWWTCTGWDAEASMRRFMLAKPHGPAMRKLRTWCDEAAVVHWTQSDEALPSWPEAHRRMQLEGRTSKVDHPSPDQTAKVIPAPVVRAGSDIRFK
jgi:hypothetical protein